MDNYLSKFELTRVLGVRATQIANGAPSTVDIPPGVIDPVVIARMEMRAHMIPITITRTFPNGTEKVLKVSEMEYNI